jgi:hypothetical protein
MTLATLGAYIATGGVCALAGYVLGVTVERHAKDAARPDAGEMFDAGYRYGHRVGSSTTAYPVPEPVEPYEHPSDYGRA